MKLDRKKIEAELLTLTTEALEKSLDLTFSAYRTCFVAYEEIQRILYWKKSVDFWQTGKLYRRKEIVNPGFLLKIFDLKTYQPELAEDFDISVLYSMSMPEKRRVLFNKGENKTGLGIDDFFIILEFHNSIAPNFLLKVFVGGQKKVIILSDEATLFPWKYFERVD